MQATLTKIEHTGKIASNRKEDHFREQLTAISITERGLKEVVTARIYRATSRVYCCVWVNGREVHVSGGGFAGGGGYHKDSAALESALGDAGVKLDQAIGGHGETAMEEALKAVAAAVGYAETQIMRAHG